MIVCYQYRIQKNVNPSKDDEYRFYNSNKMDGHVWVFGNLTKTTTYEFPICAWKIKINKP